MQMIHREESRFAVPRDIIFEIFTGFSERFSSVLEGIQVYSPENPNFKWHLTRKDPSMGVSIIGGVIGSTLLTLVVIPASYTCIDRFRIWSGMVLKGVFAPKG